MDVPNPGTQAARDQGCVCPVLDNEHGAGWMHQPDIFVYNYNCRVHEAELQKMVELEDEG